MGRSFLAVPSFLFIYTVYGMRYNEKNLEVLMFESEEAEAYKSFAYVYDLFMDHVPYEEWCEYLTELLREHGVRDGLVLELGCGTGSMTEPLASKGYDMIGIDNSGDMLEIAMDKRVASGYDILYLMQDMRAFELYGTVKAIISVCDSMNYILEEEELLQVFRLVNNYLDPGGYFIFDMNTIHKYEQIGDSTIAENREEASFIWDNYYDRETCVNEYELAIFIPEGSQGLYRKYEEMHAQRAYPTKKLQSLLEQAGMKFIAAYDAFSHDEVKEDSERIYVIAQESGK